MKLIKKIAPTAAGAALAVAGLATTSPAEATIKLTEVDGWSISMDGRVNAFVSHVFGENRPESLDNLNWVGFNEITSPGVADSENKLSRTRVRSGYVPSTLGFSFSKKLSEDLLVSSRVELGFQITTIDPAFIADPSWMAARAVYLDLAGDWGSVRAGRDFGLFGRGNLFMNYALGHAYGLGFPCAYERMFGGSCGHVGFGTIWPDFRAQITYTTPSIADVLQISGGVFDPRTVPTYDWNQTPLPRFEGEAVANLPLGDDMGVKIWANAMQQTVGTTAEVMEMANGVPTGVVTPKDFTQSAVAFGGGVQTDLGPIHLGAAGHAGTGMDQFVVFTFNPIFIGQQQVPSQERKFRPTQAFLLHAKADIGDSWLSLGYGKTLMDRVDTDPDISEIGAIPIIREHTGISVGVYHRIDNIVLGLDYFNADYNFDAHVVNLPTGPVAQDADQNVNIVNGGVTLEW